MPPKGICDRRCSKFPLPFFRKCSTVLGLQLRHEINRGHSSRQLKLYNLQRTTSMYIHFNLFPFTRVRSTLGTITSAQRPLSRAFVSSHSSSMKRKARSPESSPRKAVKVDDYCNTELKIDATGNPIWPAPAEQLTAAQIFLKEWFVLDNSLPLPRSDCYSAAAQKPTLIVPDKDADGLSSGVIVHRTLVKLGLDPKLLDVHLVQKGSNIHEEHERKSMLEKNPSFVIVLDQGSRGGPPVIDDKEARSLIVDHHFSDEFPQDAIVKSHHVLRVCCLYGSGRVGL